MEIYDYVSADTLGHEDNEQIYYSNDYVEVMSVIHDNDAVMVRGYSHVTGDSVQYILGYDDMVGLWAV